jgi:hypothetical protein
VIIKVERSRYKCNNPKCGGSKVFTMGHSQLNSNHKVTQVLFERVARESMEFQTFKSIADEYYLSPGTVKKINKECERLFEKIEALNLDGMVMKRKDSVNAFARCRDWLKVRTSSGRVTIKKRIENWK